MSFWSVEYLQALAHYSFVIDRTNPLLTNAEQITHDLVSGIISRDQGGVDQPVEASSANYENNEDIRLLNDSDEQVLKEVRNYFIDCSRRKIFT